MTAKGETGSQQEKVRMKQLAIVYTVHLKEDDFDLWFLRCKNPTLSKKLILWGVGFLIYFFTFDFPGP